jgi:hypothetical protein
MVVGFGPRFVLDTLLVSLMIVETWITTPGCAWSWSWKINGYFREDFTGNGHFIVILILLRTYRGSCRCSLQAILEGAWLFFGKLRV